MCPMCGDASCVIPHERAGFLRCAACRWTFREDDDQAFPPYPCPTWDDWFDREKIE